MGRARLQTFRSSLKAVRSVGRTMADVAVAESKIHGLGVFAARDFAEGEIIIPIDD